MSNINDLFYTESCSLLITSVSKPNEYGVCETIHETIHENVKCSLTPISKRYAEETYGVNSSVNFECAIDYIEGCEEIDAIEVDGVLYKVTTFTVYQQFVILPKSITYGLKKM